MPRLKPSFRTLAIAFGGLAGAGILFVLVASLVLIPNLPSIESLKDMRFQVPLRVYTQDMRLVAEYGEKKRLPLTYAQVPETMIQAVLAAEDDRFYEHPGVDYKGILRAALYLARTGEKGQGGSTITMQVARNFFLSSEKTYLRKLNEILLALKIEGALSKQEILELYLNKIYLGNRAYGVGAAAQVYYGKPLNELNLPQLAMIAGLPKAPSRYNPIADPRRALIRRNYVLGRMRELNYIDDPRYQLALATPDDALLHSLAAEVDAPYVGEMARARVFELVGPDAYTGGYVAITTIDSRMQAAALQAHRAALLDYDARRPWRGAEAHYDLGTETDIPAWNTLLEAHREVNGLWPALVLGQNEKGLQVYQPALGEIVLDAAHIAWNNGIDKLVRGDLVRLYQTADQQWRLGQIPQVEGAIVALAPQDGAILALVGGFDFRQSKFNRVVQAERQPGSSFKPFIYSAALEQGYTTASIINDAPVVFDDAGLEAVWRPENYSGTFNGPMRLREALVHSRNMVSIRLLRDIGVPGTIDYLRRFGFPVNKLPRDLSLALGSGSLTPLQMASGYAVFANGGYRIEPYFLARLEAPDGQVLMRAEPLQVCDPCNENTPMTATAPQFPMPLGPLRDSTVTPAVPLAPVKPAPRVIEARNAYLMTSMMKDVINRGTGHRATVLGRSDIAGKTGTTNDEFDAWFSGFSPDIVATAWVGFDQPQPLGDNETGNRTALPMWIDFMREALPRFAVHDLQRPEGLVSVRIDPATGQLAGSGQNDAIFETFRAGEIPEGQTGQSSNFRGEGQPAAPSQQGITEQLF